MIIFMKIFILLFFVSTATWAKDTKNKYIFKNLNLTVGNWFENFKSVQTNSSGSSDNYEVAPFFSLGLDYFYTEKWYIVPEMGWVVSRNANDSRISKNLFFIKTDVAYQYTENFRLRAGTSLMILNISGDGGEENLPNGDGEDTYFIPSERRTALNQTLDLGVEYKMDKFSLRANSYIYAFLESEERMITYSLSLSYILSLEELN